MKKTYRMYPRGGVYYSEHTTTGKQLSLRTKDKKQAEELLAAMNKEAEFSVSVKAGAF